MGSLINSCGGSRGGARGAWAPPYFLDQTEAQRAEKKFFWDCPLPIISGSGWPNPLSSEDLKVWSTESDPLSSHLNINIWWSLMGWLLTRGSSYQPCSSQEWPTSIFPWQNPYIIMRITKMVTNRKVLWSFIKCWICGNVWTSVRTIRALKGQLFRQNLTWTVI